MAYCYTRNFPINAEVFLDFLFRNSLLRQILDVNCVVGSSDVLCFNFLFDKQLSSAIIDKESKESKAPQEVHSGMHNQRLVRWMISQRRRDKNVAWE